jgi:hypothetical protein
MLRVVNTYPTAANQFVMYAELGAGLPSSSTTITMGVKDRTAISWIVTLPPIRLITDKGTPRKTTTYKYIF